MKRTGECNRCGYCCGLPQKWQTEKEKRMMRVCNHLKVNQDGKATCDLYEQKQRPAGCILFPDRPENLPKNCGFKFIE